MNSTNITTTKVQFVSLNEYKTIVVNAALVSLLIIIALLAVGGNTLIISVYLKCKTLHDAISTFIIHLGLTDLATGFVLFVTIILERLNLRLYSYFGCLGTTFLIQYFSLVSHFLLLVATFERYLGICKRDAYCKIMTKQAKRWLIICSWSLPLLESIIPLFGFNNWMEKGCKFPYIYEKWFLVMLDLSHFLQTAVSLIMYCKIILKARHLWRTVTPSPMQGINQANIHYDTIRKSIKGGKVIALVTVIFSVSWLPYNLSILVYCIKDTWVNDNLAHFYRVLGIANSTVNPFLFAWQRRNLRRELKSMLNCKPRSNRSPGEAELARMHSNALNSDRNTEEPSDMKTVNIQHLQANRSSEEMISKLEETTAASLRSVEVSFSESEANA